MCTLYTLAPWEVRHLIQHYRLIGRDFEEVMRGRNETLDVYPNRPAPYRAKEDCLVFPESTMTNLAPCQAPSSM
jgi:hypothetical protein